MTGPDLTAAPRVSAVIIFFNGAEFLEEAVQSVLDQDFRSFELLLVDDGSTDGSSAIAEHFAAQEPERIFCLHHPGRVNLGMSATRNLGLSHARGEFVAFLDCDDRWRPQKLREQVAILDRLPEVDAVFGSVNYWRSWAGGHDELVPTGHVRNRPIEPPEASLALYPLGQAAAPCPSDMMVRRSAALSVGGFEESFRGPLQLYEDQAFFAKLYLNSTVYFSDAAWLDYRVHAKSCSTLVGAAGQYHQVRRHFLEWFESRQSDFAARPSSRVKRRIWRALLPYRHPNLHRLVGVPARLRRAVHSFR